MRRDRRRQSGKEKKQAVKKTTPAPNPARGQAAQQAVRSVVTRLQARRDSQSNAETDLDLSELRAAIDELPSLNATKVVALHRRIVNGDYKIDSERLAEKMIALETSLGLNSSQD